MPETIYMNPFAEDRRAKIVVFTDEPQLALGVSGLLASHAEFEVVMAGPEVPELLPLVERTGPDVILVDLTPEMTLTLFAAVRAAAPAARLLLWARSFSDELLAQASDLGIAGFVRRTCRHEEFLEKLHRAAAGHELAEEEKPGRSTKVKLSYRESQLVTLLAQGLTNKEIATCLNISESTVKIYLYRLFQKVGARDRFELALFGLKNAYCGQAWWDGPRGFVMEPEEQRARPAVRSLVLVEPVRRKGYPEMRGERRAAANA
jgi:two-component system, NarL family, nitrate/nitrite response regulator NarL